MSICVASEQLRLPPFQRTHCPPTEGGTSRHSCYKHDPPTEGGRNGQTPVYPTELGDGSYAAYPTPEHSWAL